MAVIDFTKGDILAADAEALVNTVNCVGIMGRGIALQFKNAFPANFAAYAEACSRGEVQPGKMFIFETHTLTNPKYIINFPTKRHWKGKSRMEDIDSGLVALVDELVKRNIKSIAIPPLGSGLGGLNWFDVRTRIVEAIQDVDDLSVKVFEPTSDAAQTKSKSVPNMTAGRASLVALIERYLAQHLDPFVTLLEAHKLMYFMQEAGEPLRLRYSKAPFGPYAENLRHVFTEIEGHLVSGYSDGGESPSKEISLVPGAVADAEAFLSDKSESLRHLSEVADLVDGFETPFGLELLSTVHWVATREAAENVESVANRVYAWGPRKRQFSVRQISMAWETLHSKNWLGADADQTRHQVVGE